MAREASGPKPLAWSLDKVAQRVKRVDLVGLAAVESVWGAIESARRSEAAPVKLSDSELVVAVPSGAHAARARRDAAAILAELGTALAEPPRSLRVVVRPEGGAR